MQGIAREAGVSAGTIYLYFSNKADLLRAVCRMKHESVHLILSGEARAGETPLESFGRIGRQMGEAYDDPGLREQTICSFEAVLAGTRDPDGFGVEQSAITREITSGLEALMSGAQALGELDPTLNAEDLAVVLHAFALGLRELHLLLPEEIDARRAYDLVGRLVRGEVERRTV